MLSWYLEHAEPISSDATFSSLICIDPETSELANACYSKKFFKKTKLIFARVSCVGCNLHAFMDFKDHLPGPASSLYSGVQKWEGT